MRYSLLLLVVLGMTSFYSCNQDSCQEQYCLNGGDCLDGDCMCPIGWTGEHCEEAGFSSSTYNCASGNCIAASGGTYSSLVACQNACGSSNTRYNCNSGNCVTASGGVYGSLAACQNACSNANQTMLKFHNSTFTPIYISINGINKIISPSQSVIFTGSAGTIAQRETSTWGVTTQGDVVGLTLTWPLHNHTFPATGTQTFEFSIPSDYFFLVLINESSNVLNELYVNYGLNSQVFEDITLPNNNSVYEFGYYEALSNSNVRLYRPNGSYYQWEQDTDFFLLPEDNQLVVLTAD